MTARTEGDCEATPPALQTAPIVACCAAVCCGVAAGLQLSPGLPAGALAVGLGIGLRVWARRRHGTWWRAIAIAGVVVLFCGLGLLRGGLAGAGAQRHGQLADALPGAGTVVGVVRDGPVARRGETVVVLDVERTSGDPSAEGALAFTLPGRTDLLPGDEVSLAVSRLRAPDDHPGPLSAAALTRQGVDAVAVSPQVTVLNRGGPGPARWLAQVRSGITARLEAAAPEPGATLVAALAFGIHQPVPADVSRPLQDSGLAHLEATSGLKVAIVAALLARFLALLAAGPRVRAGATVTAVAGYVVIAGGGAAAVRSAVMSSVSSGLRHAGRRLQPIVLLAMIATAMLMVDPRLCGDIGFQLSFLGTLGIVVAADSVAARLPGPRIVAEAAAVTVAAQVTTLPVQGAAFGVISLVGPVANALAIPLVPAVVLLAWTGIGLSWLAPPLGAPMVWAASSIAEVVLDIARVTSSLPGAAIRPGAWPAVWTAAAAAATLTIGAAWWAVGRAPQPADEPAAAGSDARARQRVTGPAVGSHGRRALLLAAAVTAVAVPALAVAATRPDGRLHVSVLDVGAGPAVLVRTAAGGLALVDGGPDPARLLTALGSAVPPLTHRIDTLLLTGGERAATSGLVDLASHYGIGRVVVPDGDLGSATRAAVLALRDSGAAVLAVPVGTPWRWDGADWRCAGAAPPADPAGVVAPVCALQVVDGGSSALILGDLPAPRQEELAGLEGASLRSQLLVAPPDGLVAPALIDAAGPRFLAVPSSRAPKVRLAGIAVRTTAADGTLRYAGGPAGLGAAP